MSDSRVSLLLDNMLTAVEVGFSYDHIMSVPETGLEDVGLRPGLAGRVERGMKLLRKRAKGGPHGGVPPRPRPPKPPPSNGSPGSGDSGSGHDENGDGQDPSLHRDSGFHDSDKDNGDGQGRGTPPPTNGSAGEVPNGSSSSPVPPHSVPTDRLRPEDISALIAADRATYKSLYEEQLAYLRTENERLLRETSQLQIQLQLKYHGAEPQLNDNDASITTSITTVTTIITRIEEWKTRPTKKDKGQIIISNEELELLSSELSLTSSQVAELQQRYTELLGVHGSMRQQVAPSESDAKEQRIASLSAQVARLKNTDTSRIQEIATLREEMENLQIDGSAREAELQQRLSAQSKDLDSLRGKLHAKTLLIEEMDRKIASTNAEVAELEERNRTRVQEMTVAQQDHKRLHGDFSVVSFQYADLQKRCDAQAEDCLSVRKAVISKESSLREKEHLVTCLTDEVAWMKHENSMKTEQLATARGEIERLWTELSSSNSRLEDLQTRYADRVRDKMYPERTVLPSEALDVVIAEKISQHEDIITSLGARVDRLGGVGAANAEQIADMTEQVKGLKHDLSVSTSQFHGLRDRHETLSREFTDIRSELQVRISSKDTDRTISSLTTEVGRLKDADANKARQIVTSLEQAETLRHEVSTFTSRLADLQRRFNEQSVEYTAAHDELRAYVLSHESKGRTVDALEAELQQCKSTGATSLEQAETLRYNVSRLTSQLADLQRRFDEQSSGYTVVRDELHTCDLSSESKDRTIDGLKAQLEQWKSTGPSSGEHVTALLKQVETLQQELITSSSRLHDLRTLYDEQSCELGVLRDELEQLKSEGVAKEGRLVTTLEQQVFTLTSQLADLQDGYDQQSRKLTAVREELKTSTSSCEDKVTQLQQDLSRSETEVVELRSRRYELSYELRSTSQYVSKLERDLSTFTTQLVDLQSCYDERSRELAAICSELEISIFSDKTIIDQTFRSSTTKFKEWIRVGAEKEEHIARLQQYFTTAQLAGYYDEQSRKPTDAGLDDGDKIVGGTGSQDTMPPANGSGGDVPSGTTFPDAWKLPRLRRSMDGPVDGSADRVLRSPSDVQNESPKPEEDYRTPPLSSGPGGGEEPGTLLAPDETDSYAATREGNAQAQRDQSNEAPELEEDRGTLPLSSSLGGKEVPGTLLVPDENDPYTATHEGNAQEQRDQSPTSAPEGSEEPQGVPAPSDATSPESPDQPHSSVQEKEARKSEQPKEASRLSDLRPKSQVVFSSPEGPSDNVLGSVAQGGGVNVSQGQSPHSDLERQARLRQPQGVPASSDDSGGLGPDDAAHGGNVQESPDSILKGEKEPLKPSADSNVLGGAAQGSSDVSSDGAPEKQARKQKESEGASAPSTSVSGQGVDEATQGGIAQGSPDPRLKRKEETPEPSEGSSKEVQGDVVQEGAAQGSLDQSSHGTQEKQARKSKQSGASVPPGGQVPDGSIPDQSGSRDPRLKKEGETSAPSEGQGAAQGSLDQSSPEKQARKSNQPATPALPGTPIGQVPDRSIAAQGEAAAPNVGQTSQTTSVSGGGTGQGQSRPQPTRKKTWGFFGF